MAPVAIETSEIDCDFSLGPCSVSWGESRLELEVDPRPLRAGRESVFRLRSPEHPEALAASGEIDFEMPGMEMGEHRLVLSPTGDRSGLEGRIALPTCPLGGNLWKAEILLPGQPSAELKFRVQP